MNSNSLLYAVVALTGLTVHSAAGDTYREMFAIRSSIQAAIGENEWMISHMVLGCGTPATNAADVHQAILDAVRGGQNSQPSET